MNGKSCPGETVCTTDCVKGEIAGLHGKRDGRTLENYCHDKPATKDGQLKTGCPLFPTKADNVDITLAPAIGLAEQLRKYKTRGCLIDIEKQGMVEFACFDAAEEASSEIEAEAMNESTNTTSAPNSQTPMGKLGEVEEGGAFGKW